MVEMCRNYNFLQLQIFVCHGAVSVPGTYANVDLAFDPTAMWQDWGGDLWDRLSSPGHQDGGDCGAEETPHGAGEGRNSHLWCVHSFHGISVSGTVPGTAGTLSTIHKGRESVGTFFFIAGKTGVTIGWNSFGRFFMPA
jgi:hypothetical protein